MSVCCCIQGNKYYLSPIAFHKDICKEFGGFWHWAFLETGKTNIKNRVTEQYPVTIPIIKAKERSDGYMHSVKINKNKKKIYEIK